MAMGMGYLVRHRMAASLLMSKTSSSSRCNSGGGDRRELMSAEEIEERRYKWIKDKIWREYREVDVYDSDFLKLERMGSDDYQTLKSLWKDILNFNRKNGVIPSSPKTPPPPRRFNAFTATKDDDFIIEFGQLAVEKYNNDHASHLLFSRVLSVQWGHVWTRYIIFISASDPSASRVPVNLQAFCSTNVDRVVLCRPVPSVDLLLKNGTNTSKLSIGEREALLYTNIRNCPIIDRRLGLMRHHSLYPKDSRGSIVKLSLDNIVVGTVAVFAVKDQSSHQVPKLEFLRVIGALVEKFVGDRLVYHIVLEALEDGVQRRFYAAVSLNTDDEDPELMVWVATDSPRATIS